jgi:hypothetical protein
MMIRRANRLRSSSYGESAVALAKADGSALQLRTTALFAYLVYFTPAVLIAKLVYAQPTTISMLLLLVAVTMLARQQAIRATS